MSAVAWPVLRKLRRGWHERILQPTWSQDPMNLSIRQCDLPRLVQSAGFNVLCGVLLASLWTLFTCAHLVTFKNLGEPRLLLLVIAETLAAGFYLVRSSPKSVSV